jgi:hypothetical protein
MERASVRVALIELPPYDPSPETIRQASVVRGRLADSFSYFVETPVVAVLSDGRVESIIPGTSISGIEDLLTQVARKSRDAPDSHGQAGSGELLIDRRLSSLAQ